MPQSYWTPAEKASPEYKNALDAINEYMELSQQQEDSDVKYFASLSEKQFLDTILSYLNDPTSRDSMRIATAREAIIQRQIGLK
jgi:hypothetical protein